MPERVERSNSLAGLGYAMNQISRKAFDRIITVPTDQRTAEDHATLQLFVTTTSLSMDDAEAIVRSVERGKLPPEQKARFLRNPSAPSWYLTNSVASPHEEDRIAVASNSNASMEAIAKLGLDPSEEVIRELLTHHSSRIPSEQCSEMLVYWSAISRTKESPIGIVSLLVALLILRNMPAESYEKFLYDTPLTELTDHTRWSLREIAINQLIETEEYSQYPKEWIRELFKNGAK